MRNLLSSLVSIVFLTACTISNKLIAEADFKVWGNCNVYKETIESSLNVDGVSKAGWNTESKQIVVIYDSTKISLDAVLKLIAKADFDDDKYSAGEETNSKIPQCRQYERKS